MEAVDMVRRGIVKPVVKVRPFRDLPQVYEEMERLQQPDLQMI
jgi:propanol-preferring alcohol dehydrogenase